MDEIPSARTRRVAAARPRPELEGMRTAYLELLKLSLCDLIVAETESVFRPHGEPARHRPIEPDEISYRVEGKDWPLRALTMVGLLRLDDLQACVEAVVEDGVDGDLIEAGTWRGGSSILMRATLDALGADERIVFAADSFQGFPESDEVAFPEERERKLAELDYLVAPLAEVKAAFARFGLDRGVEFVPGFFDETLPALSGQRWAIVRLDGDTYEATRLGLEALYPRLSRGGYVIIDDYRFIAECREAVHDFRREQGITEPIVKIDWNSARWRRESDPDPATFSASGVVSVTPSSRGSERAVARAGREPLRSQRELELEAELSALRPRPK